MFSQNLINWFNINKRDLPWRKDKNFYNVWVAEIMLQQTQVQTVVDYYIKFLNLFPTLTDLANANINDVLKAWEGLGYYSRAKNLHHTAKFIVTNLGNKPPTDYSSLIKLPGFGPYTTSAVLSFTYNQDYAVVDGNVKRVISRFYGLLDDIKTNKAHNKIQLIVNKLLTKGKSALFNEAIMELGATICVKSKPLCQSCPINKNCRANNFKLTEKIPFSKKKKQVPTLYYIAKIANNKSSYSVFQRPIDSMLGGLWGFHLTEIKKLSLKAEAALISDKKTNLILGHIKHTYSHFKIDILIEVYKTKRTKDLTFVSYQESLNLAFDKASHKIWKKIMNWNMLG